MENRLTRALVDDWRNDTELTKGDEKTVFRFDMRPMLTSASRLELVALTLIAGTPKLEQVIKNFDSTRSWPEAFAEAGLSFVDTSTPRTSDAAATGSSISRYRILHLVMIGTIYWNSDALQKHFNDRVRLIGENWTFELSRPDLSFFLVSAKACCGWDGGQHLFRPFGKSIGLYLNDGQVVTRSDAAELAKALEGFCTAQSSKDAPQIKTVRELAALTSKSGFRIGLVQSQLLRGPTTKNPSKNEIKNLSGQASKQKSGDQHGFVFFLSFIVAIALGPTVILFLLV